MHVIPYYLFNEYLSIYDVFLYIITATLLQNYRCHFSIVKLTSELFEYPQNLKSLSRSQLHPLSYSTKSGLEFVATSLKSEVEPNDEDEKLYYDEAITTLAQVGLL